jgi:molybdenum cofactor cytidylyltransferase
MKFGVVILAAGASSRMGQPKLLLPWGGTSVLGHLLRLWRGLSASQIAVVCVAGDHALHAELDRLGVSRAHRVINPKPERGMFSSIQCAASWERWEPALSHYAISLGDQPNVRPDTLRRLLDFAAVCADQVCQPSRKGRGRHPVFLPAAVFARLRDSTAADLKQFLTGSGFVAARCEMDDAGLDLDLDEPADYERALVMANGRNPGT